MYPLFSSPRAHAAAETIRVSCYPNKMSSTNEEPRQWQWIFRALWSAAPKLVLNAHRQDGGDDDGASATTLHPSCRRTQCHLHLLVPDTILFQQGEPRKWVGCSPEGVVVRKPFLRASSSASHGIGDESVSCISASRSDEVEFGSRHPTLTARVATKRRARTLDDFEVAERLDNVIAAFLTFAGAGLLSMSNSSSSAPDVTDDMPVCIARYNDGTTEVLSVKSLKTLCKFYNWRASLCALQAYVHLPHETTTATRIGTYTRNDERHEKNPHHRRCPRPPSTAQDRNRVAPGSAHADGQPPGLESSTPISSTFTTSEAQSAGGSQAVAADNTSSTPPSLQVSTAALDHATKDVAFVADMSYAWPAESSHTTTRRGHGNAAATKNNQYQDRAGIYSPERQDNETSDGGSSAVSRPVLVVGGRSGEPRCHSPPWPKSRIRVSRLEAEFVVDHAGRPWFTNVSKVCFVYCSLISA